MKKHNLWRKQIQGLLGINKLHRMGLHWIRKNFKFELLQKCLDRREMDECKFSE
ncbi:hypothetical protein ES332_D01G229900v1 [Gossypium tomentosum]|uniref:Uncharacterized protein n=1 Tax=Gossypium tomentosum TaxID=34277 RepID=A0A5D2MCE0_GOSTO|nr:hypothetical protein ES332_D01G229900v1 [Gossypium tomentosum]